MDKTLEQEAACLMVIDALEEAGCDVEYMDYDTGALSILGVTTPSGVGLSITINVTP